MSNILGKVLSGVAKGFLQNRSDLRANRQEDENWQKQQERRRQELDMNEEYNIKREDRQRTNRIGDEEAAYQKNVSRSDEMTNKKIQEIAKLYPDRWKDPKFQQEATSLIKGIKVPSLPANKQIAELAMAGKIKEAMQLALRSDNPEDQQFLQTAITSMKQAETLKKLLNPEPSNEQRYGIKLDNDFIQGALDQGNSAASGIISKFIPGMGGGVMQTPSKAVTLPATAMNEKTIKPIRQIRDEAAKELVAIREKYKGPTGDFDPSMMVGSPDQFRYQEAEDRYNKAATVVNKYNDSVLSGNPQQSQSQPQTGKSPAFTNFMNLSQQFLDAGKAPERNIVKRSEAK